MIPENQTFDTYPMNPAQKALIQILSGLPFYHEPLIMKKYEKIEDL